MAKKIISEDTRAKMALAHKKRWAERGNTYKQAKKGKDYKATDVEIIVRGNDGHLPEEVLEAYSQWRLIEILRR